ncbi:TMV resistance protein N-like isoform X3 [Vigna unguiculata]|nr:TMV resistance protein N-like isoform X3 [Vigna unguiculata]
MGTFGEALAHHEKKLNSYYNMEKLERWKMALHQVANLSGYHFKHGEGYEYEFIERIVELVCSKINRVALHVSDYPVGLESQVLQVKMLLDVGSDDVVHMVGFHGLGGVGKTTLVVAVYNSIADHFEALCFLENVREASSKHGLLHLQSTLLSETVGEIKLTSVKKGISIIQHRLQQKKVLLILDDVDKEEQLQALAGRPHWFGLGSRVIITTRDKQLLKSHGVERTYEVKELNEENALELLTWKAFKFENFDPSYKDVLNLAVTYASGLPLALEVIGSNLFGRNIEQWKSGLDQYKKIPKMDIQDTLKVSYDALEEDEQSVFLDIACFFKNYDLAEVEDILRAHHGHNIKHHIDVLVEKSLIKISLDGKVTLHDLIKDMGREIVRRESPKEPGKRSRLWFLEDIVQVLEDNKGSGKIETICMDFPSFEEVEIEWDGDAFKKMKNLRTLIIRNGHFSTGPKHLPNSLRVMEWWRYPSQNFPQDFHPKKLSIFKLPYCEFTSLELNDLVRQKFVNMTSLNFDECRYLKQIPDVSCLTHLENLSFRWCPKLSSLHYSVGFLEKLKILDAEGCSKLKSFPPIKLTSLEQLKLRYCHSLENFPEVLGNMENVRELDLKDTPIKKFPLSFQNLTRLQKLHLCLSCGVMENGCDGVPLSSICMMPELVDIVANEWKGELFCKANEGVEKVSSIFYTNVQYLQLRCCNLTDDFFLTLLPWFANMKNLDLSGNNFIIIPECIKEFHFLTRLNLNFCEQLQEIKGIPPNLKYFSAIDCISLTSSCRSMLLNQELHEAGSTFFYLPGAKIVEWFEFQTLEVPICFWFHGKLPAMVICLAMERMCEYSSSKGCKYRPLVIHSTFRLMSPIVIINGNEHLLQTWEMMDDCTCVFDLRETKLKNDFDEQLLENEWNHAEVTCRYVSLGQTLIKHGIHVLKQDSSVEEIRFTDPCKKRNLDIMSSIAQNHSSNNC